LSLVAKGEFVVSITPLEFEGGAPDSPLGRMSIDKQITGDLVATTQGQMLTGMTPVQGSAGYVAVEYVTGALHGMTGAFVLLHTGLMNRGEASLSVVVVPDSGTGALAGMSGEFTIIRADGKHFYELNYTLPEQKGH
jgi:hypothetical protein